MSDERYVERTTVSDDGRVHREEVRVRDGSSAAGWWVAALIAIVAVVGVLFMLNANTADRNAELQAARDQGAAEATLANAAADAQAAAAQASQAAQSAMDSTARAAEQAAANAQAAAQQSAETAQSTADAARDATAIEAPPQ
jgi:hypothetical protein